MKQSEILHETRLDEEANLNPRTRIVGMKWVKLGEGKDPEFMQRVFLYRNMAPAGEEIQPTYHIGSLQSIEVRKEKKMYSFQIEGEDGLSDTFTHYCIPNVPGK